MLDLNCYNMNKNGVLQELVVEQPIINIPAEVTKIENDLSIINQNMIEVINFGKGIKSVGQYAFSKLPNLKQVNFEFENDNDLVLGDSAFECCSELEIVKLPKNVDTINTSCFAYCFKLPFIVIPTTTKKVGFWAFERCNENNIKLLFNGSEEDFDKITNSKTLKDFYNVVTKEKMQLEDLINCGFSFTSANRMLIDINRS